MIIAKEIGITIKELDFPVKRLYIETRKKKL
jgi:hypothetical protein